MRSRSLSAALALVLGTLSAPADVAAATACYTEDCGACNNGNSWTNVTALVAAADFGADPANTPIGFIDPGDGLPHRFVVTQEGKIWVYDPRTDSLDLSTPFLDLTSKVEDGGERGLLSVVFDPEYAATGELYVYYTGATDAPGAVGDIVVERYSRDPSDPDRALLASAETILVVSRDSSQANHNGGTLLFGADGLLYVSIGDGGGGCDDDITGSPNGQKTTSLLGKLLRIDVRALDPGNLAPECGAAGSSYGVPPLNPYAGVTAGCGEIWAYGLRNPFRMTVDRATGDHWIADVGQGAWEEMNFLPGDYFPLSPGDVRNFGWRCREGCENRTCDDTPADCTEGTDNLISTCSYPMDFDVGAGVRNFWDPVLCHANGASSYWRAILSGPRYRGAMVPSLANQLFYADVYCGQIWTTTSFDSGNPAAATSECWDGGNGGIYSFAEDHIGEMYLVFADGRIQCVHNGGDGCYWAKWGGIFEDDFESPSHDTSHWSATQPPN